MTAISDEIWKKALESERAGQRDEASITAIRSAVEESREPASIAFGTSGWRGIIGRDYTLYNVQRVSAAILKLYQDGAKDAPPLPLGVKDFAAFAGQGVLLGHDTRFMGPEFAKAVAVVFARAGVRVGYAGVATTPEFSAALKMGAFACSINLTPSHNPGNYGGYKFNPADGGAAGGDITRTIEKELKSLQWPDLADVDGKLWEEYPILNTFEKFYSQSQLVDLNYCRKLAHSGKVALAVDSVYGATKGRLAHLLAHPKYLDQLRIENEPFFKGLEPEPSGENLDLLRKTIDGRKQSLKLGFILDPDGDRVQFYDGESHLTMNDFGAIAFHYLVEHRKLPGGLARSVATSTFADAVAAKNGRPVYQTAVGFKNFRQHLLEGTQEPALICFEESDGISGWGHTLEKDAQLGCMLALEIVGRTGLSLTAYLKKLKAEFPNSFFKRFAESTGGLQGPELLERLESVKDPLKPGSTVAVGGQSRKVADLVTLDGVKAVFEDGSWFLIRPSGTEPKVRIYAESQANEQDTSGLHQAARGLLQQALG